MMRARRRQGRGALGSVAVAVAVAALAASCADGSGDGAATSDASAVVSPAAVLPDITVRDVTDDVDIALRDFAPSRQPVLYWFWAPH